MRFRKSPFGVEPLEGRAMLSVAFVDLGANHAMSAAQAIQLDPSDGRATVLGRVDDSGPRDFYRLTPTASGTVRLTLSELGLNPVDVDVVAASGRRIAHVAAPGGFGQETFSIATTEPVYLQVRGTGHGIGVYQITLAEPAGPRVPNPDPSLVHQAAVHHAAFSGASHIGLHGFSK